MLRPDEIRESIYEITPRDVKNRGFKAIVCDLDDTLLPHNNQTVPGALINWLREMTDSDIPVMILSNGRAKRISPVCKSLGVPFCTMACKPFPFGFYKVKRYLKLKGREILFIGDQVFTDVIGGNLAGMYTVLVTPITLKTSRIERFKRCLEKPFRKARRGKHGE